MTITIGNLELPDGYILRGKMAGITSARILRYLRKKHIGNPVFANIENPENNPMLEAIKKVTNPQTVDKIQSMIAEQSDIAIRTETAKKKLEDIEQKQGKTADDMKTISDLTDEIEKYNIKNIKIQSDSLEILIDSYSEAEEADLELENDKIEVLESIAKAIKIPEDKLFNLDEPKKDELIMGFYKEEKNGMRERDGDSIFNAFFIKTQKPVKEAK